MTEQWNGNPGPQHFPQDGYQQQHPGSAPAPAHGGQPGYGPAGHYPQPGQGGYGDPGQGYAAPGPVPPRRNNGLVIGLIVGLVVLIGAGVGSYFLFFQKDPAPAVTANPATPNAPQVPGVPQDPAVGEPQVPTMPTMPNIPTAPVNPNTPIDPDFPVDPNVPVDPYVPVEPQMPTMPVEPQIPTGDSPATAIDLANRMLDAIVVLDVDAAKNLSCRGEQNQHDLEQQAAELQALVDAGISITIELMDVQESGDAAVATFQVVVVDPSTGEEATDTFQENLWRNNFGRWIACEQPLTADDQF